MAWIRSLKGETLINAKCIQVDPVNNHSNKWLLFAAASDNAEWGADLAQFDTREAAFEELDAIERWLEEGGQGVYRVRKGGE